MKDRRYEKASAFGLVIMACLFFPSEALVSGSNRTIPFDQILKKTQAFLLVDLASHKTLTRIVRLPVPNKDPLKFEFDEQSIRVLDIIYLTDKLKNKTLKKGSAVRYLSIAVPRSLTYQMKVAIDGARRRMWYDQNPAFDEERTGTQGLLLLQHYDDRCNA